MERIIKIKIKKLTNMCLNNHKNIKLYLTNSANLNFNTGQSQILHLVGDIHL
jgi:hypothetical protein